MQLHGAGTTYSLDSQEFLDRAIILRRSTGSIISLVFAVCFWHTNNMPAFYTSVGLAILAPMLYVTAWAKGMPRPFLKTIPVILVTAFTIAIVFIVYQAREHEFSYLVVFPAIIALYSSQPATHKWLLSSLTALAIGAIISTKLGTYPLMTYVATVFLVFCFAQLFHYQICVDSDVLADLALRDPLTGFKNRRALELHSDDPLAQQALGGVVFFDIDDFKAINRKHGHIHGDQVLKQIAALIEKHLTSKDLAFRFDGNQFVVAIGHNNSARKVCFDVKSEIQKLSTLPDTRITLSAGVAFYDKTVPFCNLVRDAETAMLHARKSGRNKAALFGNPILDLNELSAG